eukprot:702333-Amphidinium_carterae.1
MMRNCLRHVFTGVRLVLAKRPQVPIPLQRIAFIGEGIITPSPVEAINLQSTINKSSAFP